ncbi:MAG: ABC transporter ATP-binding protein [Gemmatimonadaceae bacterium]
MIELQGVSKVYRSILGRAVTAVEDFSLKVDDGEVLGVAGPNGAGKSTLIAMLLGFTRPTAGNVSIDGVAPRRYVERNGVGYLSELVQVPPRWHAETALRRYALLSGASNAGAPALAASAIKRLGLDEHRDKKIKALSKGNLQRLGFAQATLLPRRVYIFDEPTHGLDPVWTQRFRGVVTELRAPNTIVIIASHNLDELQRLTDRVAIIDHGRLQRVVTTGYVPDSSTAIVYRLTVVEGADEVRSVFPVSFDHGRGDIEVRVSDLRELNRGIAELIARGTVMAGVAPAESVLETHFREAVSSSGGSSGKKS